jgi:DNA topoisomerase-1
VDREREIELFRSQEYWQVSASFEADGTPFTARLVTLDGTKLERLSIGDQGSADAAKKVVEEGRFTVQSVETKPLSRNPPPPFTTSTLQQEAARKLGFAASHTMRIAQSLYEDGLITYMRTDGVQMAGEAISAARRAIADRYDAGYVPDKPRQYSSKAKNAQEAHEAIRPTDFSKDRAASGDHARLYSLIYNRALASQMASARLERTTVELTDGAGRATLRATGQVVLFPGFMALYDEGRDDPQDEESGRMPALRNGDAPAKTGVEAVQSFTQPPPRYSEASLVKRLEELGIGRPSTYAATLQTLKDREYVRLEKLRFIPEESGRLVTAFLERFFERYVSFDYTAELEEELDDISGGRLGWQKMLEDFWRDFKPKAGEVMDQKPSEVTAALDDFLAPYLFPDKGDGSDSRLCPLCGTGKLGLRGGKFGAFVACSNYPDCKYTRRFGQGEESASEGPAEIGNGIELKSGRFGPYLERDGKRASLPKDVPQDGLTLEMAERLLSLPREIGAHPETGLPIVASIGRYGPYLMHDGKYARLTSTTEVFDTGMNAAVVKLAEAAAGSGKARGGSREPIAVLGAHPVSGKELKVMEGRYGPYVSDGETHATLPKSADPKAITLDEASALIDARAAKGPATKSRRKSGTTGRRKSGAASRKG